MAVCWLVVIDIANKWLASVPKILFNILFCQSLCKSRVDTDLLFQKNRPPGNIRQRYFIACSIGKYCGKTSIPNNSNPNQSLSSLYSLWWSSNFHYNCTDKVHCHQFISSSKVTHWIHSLQHPIPSTISPWKYCKSEDVNPREKKLKATRYWAVA